MLSDTTVKKDLSYAFRIFSALEMDDQTYTHISSRSLIDQSSYWINPLGPFFEEICPENLVRLDSAGNQVEGSGVHNTTGQSIHGSIYQSRPDINAIVHLHTPAGVAVSSLKCGLLFLSQFSFHFYHKIAIHSYGGLALDSTEENKIIKSLGSENKALLMENHGLLTVGKTIQEAFFYMYYLDMACQVQLKAMAAVAGDLDKIIFPDEMVCHKASQQMRDFEPSLGLRDWNALVRKYIQK